MATADFYEGQSAGQCPCGAEFVRVQVLTPEGKLAWDVRHDGVHVAAEPASIPA